MQNPVEHPPGIPYSVRELREAANRCVDPYYRELMFWAAQSIHDGNRTMLAVLLDLPPAFRSLTVSKLAFDKADRYTLITIDNENGSLTFRAMPKPQGDTPCPEPVRKSSVEP